MFDKRLPELICDEIPTVRLIHDTILDMSVDREIFLGTTDVKVFSNLLRPLSSVTNNNFAHDTKIVQKVEHQGRVLIEIADLFSERECETILANLSSYKDSFESMQAKYGSSDADPDAGETARQCDLVRNNARLVVMDGALAASIEDRLVPLETHALLPTTRPLGFGVAGDWELTGVNPAMRINRYSQGHYFLPHTDAQYCPNGDERSLLSLIVYLNDNFSDGETKFYFPKHAEQLSDTIGVTVAEEMARGSPSDLYDIYTMKPKRGSCVLFSQNLIHESVSPTFVDTEEEIVESMVEDVKEELIEEKIPTNRRTSARLRNNNAAKQKQDQEKAREEKAKKPAQSSLARERFVLRSDLMTKRLARPLGFALDASGFEQSDYDLALNYFRDAQRLEVENRDARLAGSLYERALSLRYAYPRRLHALKAQDAQVDQAGTKWVNPFPDDVWVNIFLCLSERDVYHAIFAFPELFRLKLAWQQAVQTLIWSEAELATKFIPKLVSQSGTYVEFRFSDYDFFQSNRVACCRVIAMYTLLLLGQPNHRETYTVRFNQETQEAKEVEFETLMHDVFYGRNEFGSLYEVMETHGGKKNVAEDFNASVDRTYMALRHKSQHLGTDFQSKMRFKIDIIKLLREEKKRAAERRTNYRKLKKRRLYSEEGLESEEEDEQEEEEGSEDEYPSSEEEEASDYDMEQMDRMELYLKMCMKDVVAAEFIEDFNCYFDDDCQNIDAREIALHHVHSNSCLHLMDIKDELFDRVCLCPFRESREQFEELKRASHVVCRVIEVNNLIFDFDNFALGVKEDHQTAEKFCVRCFELTNMIEKRRRKKSKPVMPNLKAKDYPLAYQHFLVNVANQVRHAGYNHASCQCNFPTFTVTQFAAVSYTYLEEIHIIASMDDAERENGVHGVSVLASYPGIVAL